MQSPPAPSGGAAPAVWVTRAEPGAARTAQRLHDRGYAPLVAPLIATRALAFVAPSASAYDVLAFTSAAGVAAFATAFDGAPPIVPVFAVGDASAAAARRAGFRGVRSAAGDGRALCALILAETSKGARVLHPAASRPAFDLAAALRHEGRGAESLPVYETLPVDALPDPAQRALADRGLRAILIHSPAAGRTLAQLQPALANDITLVALSDACAETVESLRRRTIVAETPDEAAIVAALDALRLHTAPDPAPAALGKTRPRR